MRAADLPTLRAEADSARPLRKPKPGERELPQGISGRALLELQFPEIAMLCSPWIPEGVMLLAGPPKVGKSTLMRQVTRAVSAGNMLFGSYCEQGRVAYLSLEEGERLMAKKLRSARFEAGELAAVDFHWAWRQGAEGCADLRAYIDEHDDVRMIVIDSLSRFREPSNQARSQFQQDYDAMAMLSELAKQRPGLAIVVLHHTTKLGTVNDPVAAISGTYGVAAAADSYMVLVKDGSDFVLCCGGRFWELDESHFVMDRAAGVWEMRRAHDGVSLTARQREYLARVVEDGTVTTRGMASRFGVKDAAASELLKELSSRGMVERTGDGWCATAAGLAKMPSPTPVTSESSGFSERSEGSEIAEGEIAG
jgi:hypothetical protein